ncbi:hypothetical protein [Mobilicoccus caccae]|uniref:Lipoprotein antigen n=1 Tax=Mobilicoccus caccae TaxID=1859295 RepID=A0ABQ6IN49_9MICO|nr:hypothetical protein [Mobilicoccus caccae]GMA38612.1 hypothetical protein GCM10025883_06570 [Mobilicoccus caccae]
MKLTILAALPIAAIVLAGCSGNGGGDENNQQQTNAAGTSAAPVQTITPGATHGNADQADVKVTKCEATDAAVEIEAEITNTTKEKRSYIITGMAHNEKNEGVASAAIMVDDVEPGKTAKGSGRSNSPAKGEIQCTITQIESMPMG